MDQDITIQQYITISVLNHYTYQRLTVDSSLAAPCLSLSYCNLINSQSANATSVADCSILSSLNLCISEGCITRIVSYVGVSLIVNELELIVESIEFLVTIVLLHVQRINYVRNMIRCIPVSSANGTTDHILLQNTNTNVLLQVNVAVVDRKFESCTDLIVKSLLRRVPNEDLLIGVPTLLITSNSSLRTEARLLIHRRLSMLSSLPNQTLKSQAIRQQQSVVRGNISTINVVELQSNCVVGILVSTSIVLVPVIPSFS